MELSWHTLIVIIISAVTLAFILGVSMVFEQTATDTVNTCSANVQVRVGAIASSLPSEAELRGCTTEHQTLRGSHNQVREELVDGYDRCRRMYGPASSQALMREEAALCMVCGVYTIPGHERITGLESEISSRYDDWNLLNYFGPATAETQDLIEHDGKVSVLFFQDLYQDANWVQSVLLPLTSRTPFVGRLLNNPESDVTTGIVIMAHTEEKVRELGCTTINPEET